MKAKFGELIDRNQLYGSDRSMSGKQFECFVKWFSTADPECPSHVDKASMH